LWGPNHHNYFETRVPVDEVVFAEDLVGFAATVGQKFEYNTYYLETPNESEEAREYRRLSVTYMDLCRQLMPQVLRSRFTRTRELPFDKKDPTNHFTTIYGPEEEAFVLLIYYYYAKHWYIEAQIDHDLDREGYPREEEDLLESSVEEGNGTEESSRTSRADSSDAENPSVEDIEDDSDDESSSDEDENNQVRRNQKEKAKTKTKTKKRKRASAKTNDNTNKKKKARKPSTSSRKKKKNRKNKARAEEKNRRLIEADAPLANRGSNDESRLHLYTKVPREKYEDIVEEIWKARERAGVKRMVKLSCAIQKYNRSLCWPSEHPQTARLNQLVMAKDNRGSAGDEQDGEGEFRGRRIADEDDDELDSNMMFDHFH